MQGTGALVPAFAPGPPGWQRRNFSLEQSSPLYILKSRRRARPTSVGTSACRPPSRRPRLWTRRTQGAVVWNGAETAARGHKTRRSSKKPAGKAWSPRVPGLSPHAPPAIRALPVTGKRE